MAWVSILKLLYVHVMNRVVFIDESFVRTHMQRTHGRSRRGERVVGRHRHRARRYTLIGAMGLDDGMVGKWLIDRGMSEKDFVQWINEYLVPQLGPHRIIIWDNLRAHKAPEVEAALRKAGHVVLCQSRYSPDFNPIEKAWSKIKSIVRGLHPTNAHTLRQAVDKAWEQITKSDIRGFIVHCFKPWMDTDAIVLN